MFFNFQQIAAFLGGGQSCLHGGNLCFSGLDMRFEGGDSRVRQVEGSMNY
jgi:hypothetical protein